MCLVAVTGACNPTHEDGTDGFPANQRKDSVTAQQLAGRIVVNHDEWTLSDSGLLQAAHGATFARNVAQWFTGGRPGRFLAYTTNFGLRDRNLAAVMTQAGHSWTAGTTQPFTLETLRKYDAVFLGGTPVNLTVLTEYVRGGGNVYLMGGTGDGGASYEANLWNPFLQAFGLRFAPVYNGVCSVVGLSSTHPVLSGVSSLYYCNGNSVSRLDATDPHTAIIHGSPDQGLIAVFDGCPGASSCQANQPPVALCRNVTVSAGSACAASASIDHGSQDPDQRPSPLQLTQSPAGPYGLGTTSVTLTVSDGAASAQCTGTVTVVDDSLPVLQCPADLVLEGTADGAVATFSPTVSDNCGGGSITCSRASGELFPVGVTPVTCTATDGSGNTSSCGFTVTVQASSCIEIRLSDYNLFLLEDYSEGQDVQGKVAAGGDITLTDFSVGGMVPDSDISQVLVAGGNLTLSRGSVWGDAWFGGSYTTDASVVFPRGTASQGTPIDFTARFAQLRGLSSRLAGLPVNGTTQRESWGGVMLQGTAPDVNVFQVEASAFTGATLLSISAPAGSLAVVNISGDSATFTDFGHEFSGGIDQHGVLFNFVSATAISAHRYGFMGTVLAPYADIQFNNGSWDGGIYARSLTGNAEGHINVLYDRDLCP
jgi:choice-of-anchor A domain-containing protein